MKRWMLCAVLALAITVPMSAFASQAKNASMTHPSHGVVKVDLNSASKDDLMKLKGMDAATADKILASRPFHSKHDLVDRRIITKHEYDAIASHITVTAEHTKK